MAYILFFAITTMRGHGYRQPAMERFLFRDSLRSFQGLQRLPNESRADPLLKSIVGAKHRCQYSGSMYSNTGTYIHNIYIYIYIHIYIYRVVNVYPLRPFIAKAEALRLVQGFMWRGGGLSEVRSLGC